MAATEQKIELPSDLIILILSKIPTMNLLKFKCVSKQWYNWISDPCFIGQRFRKKPIFVDVDNYHSSPPGCHSLQFTVADSQGKTLYKFAKEGNTYSNFQGPSRIRVVLSCNSLICFILEPCWSTTYQHIFVCNLTTHELIFLPRQYSQEFPAENFTCGFGYLPSIEEYRFVVLFWDRDWKHTNCEVLSLSPRKVWGRDGHSQWRTVESNYPRMQFAATNTNLGSKEAVFANGCLYWLGYDLHDWKRPFVVPFTLSSEKFSRILPIPEPVHWMHVDIVNFGGCLALIDWSNSKWKLWSLREEGNNFIWINTHTIDTSNRTMHSPIVYPNRMVSDQKLLIIKFQNFSRFSLPGCICIYYNTENKEFTRIETLTFDRWTTFGVLDTNTAECLAKISI